MIETFSPLTVEHISSLSLSSRKEKGQYMTPRWVGHNMVSLFNLLTAPTRKIKILDPAVGTGELLLAFKDLYGSEQFEFHGWDTDKEMLQVAQNNLPELITEHRSIFTSLPEHYTGKFDLIIGNPPYFELKEPNKLLQETSFKLKKNTGRLNIYALFFEYGLNLLKPNGQLIYLVPPSMNNGAYFKMLREVILENSRINKIELLRANNHFADAQTSVQVIHLTKTSEGYQQNKAKSNQWVVDFNDFYKDLPVKNLPVIFTENKPIISKAWETGQSLNQLGYKVFTGKNEWNKHKNDFMRSELINMNAPLLYSKDISEENELTLNPILDKRRWLPVKTRGLIAGKRIIVNRISGGLTNPRLKFALVSNIPQYFCENHLNVIEPANFNVARFSLEELYESMIHADLREYLKALTGNTQISARELEFLIPFPLLDK